VSPTHLPPLSLSRYPWYTFQLEAESTPLAIVLSEGFSQWKIQTTPSGIEPANFSDCSAVPQPTAYSYDILNFPVILVLADRIFDTVVLEFFLSQTYQTIFLLLFSDATRFDLRRTSSGFLLRNLKTQTKVFLCERDLKYYNVYVTIICILGSVTSRKIAV
jgi:hypothetical protein